MRLLVTVTAMLWLHTLTAQCQETSEYSWEFNGRDFTGWKVPAPNHWFSIRDGVLHARSDAQRLGAILWTDRPYGDFILQLEFRFGTGTVDSGVFLRTEEEQIQIGISASLHRDMTGSPYIAGQGYPREAQRVAELLRPKDWNRMRIQVEGPRYQVRLNGTEILDFTSDTSVHRGPIGLQVHPNNRMSIDFRKIRIQELRRVGVPGPGR